ncbi:phosphonate metabolism transcriptional regulator PhnF [Rhodospirillaceae bacterium KN72]|uniref:Phosphonate metabolism transcriptional regulator PhnF n=1 Tax=Pacificispira spongiicola TaxID=2729598 RepID=A0A7Y0E1T2_9PROT|nr:phosphonate metabolism transcriptional regulator PhnF [Pacificispira spongiicola]NMM45670.1 phosphonate metabolism transcriptional regulator PhnF [Pacificispira spongiicola]
MAEIERKAGATLWHQISDALTTEIADGHHAPGTRLPTEPELMRRFGVSRHTIRQAVAHLETRGLVRAEQGRGTFVHSGVLDYAISRRTRFSSNLITQHREPGGTLLVHETVPASESVANCLGLSQGTPVIHRRGLMTADGAPIELGDSFYPADRFPDFQAVRQRLPKTSDAFAYYGISDYRRIFTAVTARVPSAEEARFLKQPKSLPVMVVEKVDADGNGIPIIHSVGIWASERVRFTIDPNTF